MTAPPPDKETSPGEVVADPNAVFEAMERELQRSMAGLRVPEQPRPHHMAYTVRRRERLVLDAAFGSLRRRERARRCELYVDVRVGSPSFDNVMDAGLDLDADERESSDWLDAPRDLDPVALQVALWKLTQIRFDEALEDYHDHRKAFVTEHLRDERDSFTNERPVRHVEKLSDAEFPLDEWAAMLVDASRRFLDVPQVHDPSISLRAERRHRWFVDSGGSRVLTESVYVELGLGGWVLTEDGVYLEASREVYVRDLRQVPDAARLGELLEELLEDLRSLHKAERLGSFIGPAFLAGQAASTMFHEAIGHRLEGGRLVARGETRTFAGKVGQRVLPAGLDVYDDPSGSDGVDQNGDLPWGGYRVDDEGVSSARAVLVEDGVLKGFLRNRTPVEAGDGSNGHGRHDGRQQTMARMSNFVVEARAPTHETDEALEVELMALARAQGRREVAIIRRIRAGETSTNSYDFQVFKGELAEVWVVDVATGARRRVRDVELIGTPLAAMQRIVGFGGTTQVDEGYCVAESGSIPVSGASPSILLSEVELQEKSTTAFHEPLLPPPFADDGSRGRTGSLRERGRRRRGGESD